MKIFGFELVGLQIMGIKCPRCGNNSASITFKPSEGDQLMPLEKKIIEGIREAGIADHFVVPKCDDLHVLCMKCGACLKRCETTKQPCQIILKEHFKAITNEQSPALL